MGDVFWQEALIAYNVVKDHLGSIAWKWEEFKETSSNDSLNSWHRSFHDDWGEDPIGRHTGKFLVKLLGNGLNLSNDVKCARFVEAWFYKSWEKDGYDRFLAAWVKYLGRQVCILLGRCHAHWQEPQSWQDLEVLARANNLA